MKSDRKNLLQGEVNQSSFTFELTKGRKCTITKEYWNNGENWVKGTWNDDNSVFDLPSVFVNINRNKVS